MFTFTKKTDYALLALSFLATEGKGRIVGPREIARRYDIPSELLAKVMQILAAAADCGQHSRPDRRLQIGP